MQKKIYLFLLLILPFFIAISNAQILKKGGNYNYIVLKNGDYLLVLDKTFHTIGQLGNISQIDSYTPVKSFILVKSKNGNLISYDSTFRELGKRAVQPKVNYDVTDNFILVVDNNALATYDQNLREISSFPLSPQIKNFWDSDNYILIMDDNTISAYDQNFQKLNDRLANQYLKEVTTTDNYIVTKEVNLTDTGIPENPNEEDDSYYIFDRKFNQIGRKSIPTDLEKAYFTNDYVLTKEGSHLYTYDKNFNKIGDKYIKSDLAEYIAAEGYIITKEGDYLYTYNPNLLKMGEWQIESNLKDCVAAKDYILIQDEHYYYCTDQKFKTLGKVRIGD
jgi:hypothetical protein